MFSGRWVGSAGSNGYLRSVCAGFLLLGDTDDAATRGTDSLKWCTTAVKPIRRFQIWSLLTGKHSFCFFMVTQTTETDLFPLDPHQPVNLSHLHTFLLLFYVNLVLETLIFLFFPHPPDPALRCSCKSTHWQKKQTPSVFFLYNSLFFTLKSRNWHDSFVSNHNLIGVWTQVSSLTATLEWLWRSLWRNAAVLFCQWGCNRLLLMKRSLVLSLHERGNLFTGCASAQQRSSMQTHTLSQRTNPLQPTSGW